MKPEDTPLPKQRRDYDKTFSAFDTIKPNWQSRAIAAQHMGELVEAAKSAQSWIKRWGRHVGSCSGAAYECTCGYAAVCSELSTILAKIGARE